MIESTFICDCCGDKYKMDNGRPVDTQMVAIELRLNFGSQFINSNGTRLEKLAVWCRQCVMAHGLTEPHSKQDKEVAPGQEPTVEEIFGDLIERLGFTRND